MLTSRDEALLRTLNRFRLARSSDLRRLIFEGLSPGRAAERLRQLFAAGYLDVRVGKLSEENVYALGPAGRRHLEGRGLALGRLPAGGLEHHLAIVSAWTRLAAAARSRAGIRLKLFRPDWEIRSLNQPLPVVPDAIAEIEGQGQELRIALEVDLATERNKVLRRKFEEYQRLQWHAREFWNWPELRLVVVVAAGGERRRAGLQRLLEQSGAGAWLVVGAHEWPDALWPLRPQTPLTDPAHGKRGEGTLSDEHVAASSTASVGHSQTEVAGGTRAHD